MMRLERCDVHIGKFTPMIMATMKAPEKDIFLEDSANGEEARSAIAKHLDSVGSENIDRGVELDLRYLNSEVIVTDGSIEPAFDNLRYTPSTRPGHRAPHVFLRHSNKSIIDLYGQEWTLIDFSRVKSKHQQANGSARVGADAAVTAFKVVATYMNMPLSHVSIDPAEEHVKIVWQDYDFVLIRPDGYVAWRGGKEGARDRRCDLNKDRVREILRTVLGLAVDPGFVEGEKKELSIANNLTSIHGVQEELEAGEGQEDAFEGFFKGDKRRV